MLTDYSVPVHAPTKPSVSHTCCLCDNVDPPISYCSECAGALCQFCLQAHRRIKMYQAHIVIPINEADMPATKLVKNDIRLACNVHPQEELNIYCMSCYTLVCCQCLVADHQTHKLATINDKTCQEVQEKVLLLLKQSTTKQQEMVTAKEYIESVEEFLMERSEKLKGTISATYEDVFKALEKKQKEHLKIAEAICTSNLKTVWANKDHVQQLSISLQSAIDFANRNFRCGNSEFLRMSNQLLSRLKEINGIQWSESNLEQLLFTGLEFKPANHDLNVGEIKVYAQKTTKSHVLYFEDILSELKLGKMTTFNVTINQSHPVCFQLPSLTAVVTYGATKKTLQLGVHMKKWGVWEVSFIPICGGEHELCIFIVSQTRATLKHTFRVIGRPWTNAYICQGPDYGEHLDVEIAHSDEQGRKSKPVSSTYQPYKLFYGNGRVRSSYYPSVHHSSMILVEWDVGGLCRPYRWGHNNCYDIQLAI